jgi:RNA polymerase sigma-70 factor (ECF subfamily)
MEDAKIVALYWKRDPSAIDQTAQKYQNYCHAIAQNILGSKEDAEECVNDTYLHAWNAIPPHRPIQLSTFLGKIVRNLSLHRYQYHHTQKRGGGELPLILEELESCVSGKEDVMLQTEQKELLAGIHAFLEQLPPDKRQIFVGRYWYAKPIAELAEESGCSINHISVLLSRMRKQLKEQLQKGGFSL